MTSSTVSSLLKEGYRILSEANVPDSSIDAKYLFEYITGISPNQILLEPDMVVEEKMISEYMNSIKLRADRIPLQYITGCQEFMGLNFKVSGDVLIPRQDTEILVEESMKYTKDARVLDMCTGSGCIAISIAKLGNPKEVFAVDISKEALNIANENAVNLGVSNCIKFIESDLFCNIQIKEKDCEKFDVIVSNPPYIPPNVVEGLMPEVRLHEPDIALCANNDGLEFYEKISNIAPQYLKKGGRILYEIGCEQAESVKDILENNSFSDIKIKKDYACLDRVVSAVWNG